MVFVSQRVDLWVVVVFFFILGAIWVRTCRESAAYVGCGPVVLWFGGGHTVVV